MYAYNCVYARPQQQHPAEQPTNLFLKELHKCLLLYVVLVSTSSARITLCLIFLRRPPCNPRVSTTGLQDASKTTTVTTYASAYDTRTSSPGCSPDGCVAALTRDRSWNDDSRWSCNKDLDNEQCKITYEFDNAQDIVKMRLKLYKGDERRRTLKITASGGYKKTITSSGTANGYENFDLDTDETEWLTLESTGLNKDDWISITEVGSAVSAVEFSQT